MNILFIAPLPPPINGQSIAAKFLFDKLSNDLSLDINLVNIAKESHSDGLTSFSRIIDIIRHLKQIAYYKNSADIIYLHISESLFGNLRDLIIYFICRKKLNKLIIHLHGGSFGLQILERNLFLKKINLFYLKKVKGVIVLGPTLKSIFSGYLPHKTLHIIPNFYSNELLISKEAFLQKISSLKKIKFLFMSNMIPKKGYLKLLDAVSHLDKNLLDYIQIDFAGRFDSDFERKFFLDRINNIKSVNYHGVATGNLKQKLFSEANVFILPTSYNEGQPISILEAYASGCAVVTTLNGGIPDIFNPDVNGIGLVNDDPQTIADSILFCVQNFEKIKIMSENNLSYALTSFSSKSHLNQLIRVLLN